CWPPFQPCTSFVPITSNKRINVDGAPRFSEAILHFLTRQPLRGLLLHSVNQTLPVPVFFCLLEKAPIIYFYRSWVSSVTSDELSDIPMTPISTLKCLTITPDCDGVEEMLALPKFAFHTAVLADLEIAVPYEEDWTFPAHAFFCSGAHTLERVCAVIEGMSSNYVNPSRCTRYASGDYPSSPGQHPPTSALTGAPVPGVQIRSPNFRPAVVS
ncbi:hypothetical protein DFH06DRAFT_61245, partial [Mycena polygramma]